MQATAQQLTAVDPSATTQRHFSLSADAQAELDGIMADLNDNGGVARGF